MLDTAPLSSYALLSQNLNCRTPTFNLHNNAASAIRTLLNTAAPTTCGAHPANVSPSELDGYARLLDRNLITLTPCSKAEPTSGFTVAWNGIEAEQAATRHLVRHFGHAPLAQAFINDQISRPDQPIRTVDAVVVLAWHYRHQPTRLLLVERPEPHAVRITPRTSRADLPSLVLPAHQGLASPDELPAVGDDYTDRGAVLPETLVALYATALAANGPVEVHLDHLGVRPAHQHPETWSSFLPGVTLDALRTLRAPEITSPEDLLAWSETGLTLSVSCSGTSHAVRLDPHTHRLAPKTVTVSAIERRDGDHFLHAINVGDVTGCENAQESLDLITNPDFYDRRFSDRLASDLTATRAVARTVQYLDAGIDLAEAAPCLRFGFTADQARRFTDLQAREPHVARNLLLAWSRSSYTGTLIEF